MPATREIRRQGQLSYQRTLTRMRIAKVLHLIVVSLASLVAQDSVVFQDDAAASLFRTSRMNMSGREATIRELLSLHMIGKIRIATPEGAVETGTTEIKILLPDRYSREQRTKGSTRYAIVERAHLDRARE